MKLYISILISLLCLLNGCAYRHNCPSHTCTGQRSEDLSMHPQTYPDSSNEPPEEFFYKCA